jgi:hypothetical protein
MSTPSTFLILAAVAAILSAAFAMNLQLSRKPKRYSVLGFAASLGLALAAVAVVVIE